MYIFALRSFGTILSTEFHTDVRGFKSANIQFEQHGDATRWRAPRQCRTSPCFCRRQRSACLPEGLSPPAQRRAIRAAARSPHLGALHTIQGRQMVQVSQALVQERAALPARQVVEERWNQSAAVALQTSCSGPSSGSPPADAAAWASRCATIYSSSCSATP